MVPTSRARALLVGCAGFVAACGDLGDSSIGSSGGGSGGSNGTQVTSGTSGSSSTSGTTGATQTGSAVSGAGGSTATVGAGAGGSADGGGAGTTAGSGGTSGAQDGGGGGATGGGRADGGIGGGATGGGRADGGIGGGATGGGDAGSTDPEGWVSIFNGTDLTGWVPLIHTLGYNMDPYRTFRADPVNHVIQVTYADYPNQSFDNRFGLLYYNRPLKNYRVRLTYRFLPMQAKNPPGWGVNNSGLMIFGIDPAKVTGDPNFPPLIEIQLLGDGSSGGTINPTTSPNVCPQPGVTLTKNQGSCGNNGTGVRARPASEWVTVEAEVHVDGADTKIFQYPNKTTPVVTIGGPKYMNMPMMSSYLSIQSESQPCEFKDMQLIELP